MGLTEKELIMFFGNFTAEEYLGQADPSVYDSYIFIFEKELKEKEVKDKKYSNICLSIKRSAEKLIKGIGIKRRKTKIWFEDNKENYPINYTDNLFAMLNVCGLEQELDKNAPDQVYAALLTLNQFDHEVSYPLDPVNEQVYEDMKSSYKIFEKWIRQYDIK